MTPSSSSSFMSWSSPSVTATDAWQGLRPVAKALGAASGTTYSFGTGRFAFAARRSMTSYSLGACSRLTGCAPLDHSAILSEKKYAKALPITAMINAMVMPLRPPKYAPRVMSTSVSAVNNNVVRRTLISFPYHCIRNTGPSSFISQFEAAGSLLRLQWPVSWPARARNASSRFCHRGPRGCDRRPARDAQRFHCFVPRALGIAMGQLENCRGAYVTGHHQYGVAEIHRAPFAVGEPAVFQDLQEHIKDVGVCLLYFVEQNHRIRMTPNLLGELAALFVADIARRRANQTRNAVLLHVLGH